VIWVQREGVGEKGTVSRGRNRIMTSNKRAEGRERDNEGNQNNGKKKGKTMR